MARGRSRRLAVRAALLALAGSAAGFVYVLATVRPDEDTYYLRCQLHALTGLHCSGCGTTRALHAILNGRLLDALAYNAVFPLVMPVVAWANGHSLRVSRGTAAAGHERTRRYGFRVLVVVVVAYGVLRNLPWHPFTLLAPRELPSP